MFYFICLDILKANYKEEKEEILQALQEFKDKIIPLIAVMKIINLYVKDLMCSI